MLLSLPLKNTSLLIPACFFSSRFTICHKTEVVKNTLNPVWQPFTIPVRALCNGDYDRYHYESHVLRTSSSPQLLFILSLLHLAAFIMPFLPPHLHLKTLTSVSCRLMVGYMVALHRIHQTLAQPAERLFLYIRMRGAPWITCFHSFSAHMVSQPLCKYNNFVSVNAFQTMVHSEMMMMLMLIVVHLKCEMIYSCTVDPQERL